MQSITTERFESTAAELATNWLDTHITEEQAAQHASALLACETAGAGVDVERLRALSKAFHALRWSLLRRYTDPATAAFAESVLLEVRAVGWPRATRLAQTAWAWAQFNHPAGRAQALALLQARHQLPAADPASGADDPVLERMWAVRVLGTLSSLEGNHAQALECGLRCEEMAAPTGHDLLVAVAANSLGFVYLSAGDVEGACAVLPAGLAAIGRTGMPGEGMLFNHLLSLVLSRRFDEAAQLLDERPFLLQKDTHAAKPAIHALVARLRLSQGRLDEAVDLPSLQWATGVSEQHTMAANRLWVGADVLLGLGQQGRARQVLEAGLQAAADAGVVMSPMNATQCHRALADACEAVGDLKAAMAALRQSQSACFAWVGQSMRARLQALHFSAPSPAPGPLQRRQALRLQLVEKALDAAQQQAHGAVKGQERSSLLAQVTHEVRNPLHGVVWMTSMLMMSDLDDRQREYLELANSSARMALSLCNDVLDLAKLDAGRFNLNPGPVDLRDLVSDCTRVFEAPASAKGLRVAWHCDAAVPSRVQADRLRLQQVLMNLLSNAVKFTSTGRVDVGLLWLGPAAFQGEATFRLSVTDTGPGLSDELIPRLFQEFEQGSEAPLQAAGGAGLGLALCRQFVRMMGGEIGVNNRPGQGCTFWCLLPLPAV